MTELVIGCQGFIGKHLIELLQCEGTSYGNPEFHHHHYLDLLDLVDDDPPNLPEADIAYICAGVNGAMKCEGNSNAYRINVDAPIKLAKHYHFTVFISSQSVEWANTAYAVQKRTAETLLRMMPNTCIVRAGRVTHENVKLLCEVLKSYGRRQARGLFRWGNDELAYQK